MEEACSRHTDDDDDDVRNCESKFKFRLGSLLVRGRDELMRCAGQLSPRLADS